MRKVILALAAAGSALAIATPAAAQYYPQPQPYGYNGYGNGFGYNNWGQVRSLQARINNVERRIDWLDRRDRIRDGRADRLRYEAERIEQRLRYASRGGLNPYELNSLNMQIARLEQRVQYAMANRYGGYGNGYNNGQFVDRDRDGRDDRYEHRRDRDDDERDGD